jgi:hypothetical protein
MNALRKIALLSLGLLAACSNSSSSYSIDRKTVNGLPTVVAVGNAEARVAVEAVDYANRSIALRGPDGVTQIFLVSPSVRNFAQIKKGDTVHVDYSTRIVASVRKANTPPSTSVTDAVQFAELGKKPGIVCTRNAQIEATVQAINYASRQMELRTAGGAIFAITADPKLKNLEAVHHGDQVIFDYVEAVSIRVD